MVSSRERLIIVLLGISGDDFQATSIDFRRAIEFVGWGIEASFSGGIHTIMGSTTDVMIPLRLSTMRDTAFSIAWQKARS